MSDINVILADYPGLGRVRLCECNSIHLTIGPVTVTLAPEAFEQAAVLIQNAMRQWKEISEDLSPEADALRPRFAQHSRLTH